MGGYGSGRPRVRPSAERAAFINVTDAQAAGLTDMLARVERPGRGVALYLRCKRCGALARVLYWDGALGCRRCVRPVYASSRASDARVSRILADDTGAELRGYATPPAAVPVDLPAGADLLRHMRRTGAGLLVLMRLAERLGSTHAGQGRPWSSARRAAHERNQ